MDISRLPACRICLSDDINPSQLFSLKDEFTVGEVESALNLEASLHSYYPNHVCGTCRDIIQQFLALRDVAKETEKFITKHYTEIIKIGLREVKINLDQENIKVEQTEEEIVTKKEVYELDETSVAEYSEGLKSDETICLKCTPERIMKKYSFFKHRKHFHKEPDIPCDFNGCVLKFKIKYNMRKHVRSYHNGERTACVECGKSFKDIRAHKKMVHDKITYSCDICDKSFCAKYTMLQHQHYKHGNSSDQICSICSAEVRYLDNHMKIMHSDKETRNVKCEDANCEKKFRTPSEALKHLNAIHLNTRKECPQCGIWYKNLPTHIYQAHGSSENRHVCEQCGKSFVRKGELRVHHERVHLKIRYCCPECGKSVSKIREHLKVVHSVTEVDKENIKKI